MSEKVRIIEVRMIRGRLGGETERLGSDQGEISITSDMQMTPPLWQKVKRN